jgi:hypothetical protein
MEYNKKIEDILDEFNFEKVHKAMEALDWTWHDSGVPTIAELRRSARRLLNKVAEHDGDIEMSGGGFQVQKEYGDIGLFFYIDNVWASEL